MASQKERVLKALLSGKEMSSKQIASRFSVGNPYEVIRRIRNDGIPVMLKEFNDRHGNVTRKYALGILTKKQQKELGIPAVATPVAIAA